MTLDPNTLGANPDLLEAIEKASLRHVVQAVHDFMDEARVIFREEAALVDIRKEGAAIGEDLTREALDRMGTSVIPLRLFGKIDYKRARYVFHPDYSVRQALFVDSKAEEAAGQGTATIQTTQTSMRIRQMRGGVPVDEAGALPTVILRGTQHLLTTTIFVKYNYREVAQVHELESIIIACLPNGMLQAQYNQDATHTFWLVGRNAPTLGEQFRARIGFERLKARANWRVQYLRVHPRQPFRWDD